MLILIGVVPTAYALNRALPDSAIPPFLTTSTYVTQALDRAAAGRTSADPRADIRRYLRTHALDAAVVPALAQLARDIQTQVEQHGSLRAFSSGLDVHGSQSVDGAGFDAAGGDSLSGSLFWASLPTCSKSARTLTALVHLRGSNGSNDPASPSAAPGRALTRGIGVRRRRVVRQHGRGDGVVNASGGAGHHGRSSTVFPMSKTMADGLSTPQSGRGGRRAKLRHRRRLQEILHAARSTSLGARVRSTPRRAAQCQANRIRVRRTAGRLRQPRRRGEQREHVGGEHWLRNLTMLMSGLAL